ncbi:hypothetical protein BJ508DRAFT_364036 [Ascobolus immersus RN42]|uniref:Uncharacterized protein n=1 Tax=Ascobolus immersus RN42 TaxID=1160509 RepID=A0A3N4I8C8_ASCIM|nr:hypothetical protein BJ508DRAFT_364036 [Ascobolus immersus RN42]
MPKNRPRTSIVHQAGTSPSGALKERYWVNMAVEKDSVAAASLDCDGTGTNAEEESVVRSLTKPSNEDADTLPSYRGIFQVPVRGGGAVDHLRIFENTLVEAEKIQCGRRHFGIADSTWKKACAAKSLPKELRAKVENVLIELYRTVFMLLDDLYTFLDRCLCEFYVRRRPAQKEDEEQGDNWLISTMEARLHKFRDYGSKWDTMHKSAWVGGGSGLYPEDGKPIPLLSMFRPKKLWLVYTAMMQVYWGIIRAIWPFYERQLKAGGWEWIADFANSEPKKRLVASELNELDIALRSVSLTLFLWNLRIPSAESSLVRHCPAAELIWGSYT